MESKSVLNCFLLKVKPLKDHAKGTPNENLSQHVSPTPEVPDAFFQSSKQTDQHTHPETDVAETASMPESVMTAIEEEFLDAVEPPPP
ncbi:hypothetical protein WJX74_010972 [Apatococcus lobatus]|uniref:Uncharacterized protein n=1 Tax=Apatococcus lobatus TaxID=904363 RepID=A0AAW1QH00_9CHLO